MASNCFKKKMYKIINNNNNVLYNNTYIFIDNVIILYVLQKVIQHTPTHRTFVQQTLLIEK